MRQVGEPVHGFDAPLGLGERGFDVAGRRLLDELAPVERCIHGGGDRLRRCLPVRSVAPLGLQRRERIAGPPGVVGEHDHRVALAHHPLDARHGQRRRLVDVVERAAEHRSGADGAEQHARNPYVHAIDQRAVHLGGDVEARQPPADDPVAAGGLEGDVADGDVRSALGQRAEGLAAPARPVVQHARLGLDLAFRHLPRLGRRGDQHGTPRGAEPPHALDAGEAHRHRAAGQLQLGELGDPPHAGLDGAFGGPGVASLPEQIAASERVVDEGEIGRRLLDAHLRPVSVELFGQHHRQRRVDALAHLGMRHDHRHAVVGADAQPRTEQSGVGAPGQRLHALHAAERIEQPADGKPAERRSTADDQRPPRKPGRAHERFSWPAAAAIFTARRMSS